MAVHVKNMTEGAPVKLILTFSLSLVAGNVFQQLYVVVDTMVVGNYLGVNALAALGASDWLNWLMLGMIQGLTQGFGIKMAQEFGAGRMAELKKSVGNSAVLSLLSAVLLLAAGQFAARPVLVLLQTPTGIIEDSLLYLRILFAGVPIVMLYNLLACILRSLGDSRTPLHAMIVASLTNIVLDYLFVMGFGWGIAGAAAATVIAQAVSGLFCFFYIKKITFLRMERADFRLQEDLGARLFVLGLPMAFQNAIIAIGGMIVQFVVNGYGVLFIAGFTATNKLYGLLEIAGTSYGYAMVTYVGQNLGAGKLERIRSGMRAAMGIAMLTSVAIAVCMILFGKYLLGLFISGTPEVVEQTMQIAYFYLAVMSVSLPILYVLHVTRSALQGMGNTVLPMLSGVAEFVMRTSAIFLLPMLFGEVGIFFAETAAWIGADVVLVSSYFSVFGKLQKIMTKSENAAI
ncbi:MAG: MATE family efflux transporter [bacterium]|nr:MATE family efflux transporter [bacterium]MCM1422925.1 MATE family efflux transporter [bacterium]